MSAPLPPAPPPDFSTLSLYFDPDDGSAVIDGQVHTEGLRLVHIDPDAPDIFVVKRPGHNYSSLAGAAYAPASFEIYEADYGTTAGDYDQRLEDHPWIRVRKVTSFPVQIGTKRLLVSGLRRLRDD